MSETTDTKAVLDAAPTPQFKMSIGDTVKMLQTYDGQADSTIAQLDSNIAQWSNSINEAQKMKLMIIGQKQLIKDVVAKAVVAPNTPDVETPA